MHPPPLHECATVELRQYTLRPGALPALLALFESELVEPQEAAGMRVAGLFADVDDPDRFVWMRGFDGMEARRTALEQFYGGPVWARHADAANATMLDSDDVLLLRPTRPAHPPLPPAGPRADAGLDTGPDTGLDTGLDTGPVTGDARVVVTTWLHAPDRALTRWLTETVHGVLEEGLATAVATWRTEPAANTFPRLPVRTDSAFVWLASYPDEAAAVDAEERLRSGARWRNEVAPRLDREVHATQRLRLRPTSRSQHPRPGAR